jgi:hypothetical protein
LRQFIQPSFSAVLLDVLAAQAGGFWALVQRTGLHDGTLRVPFAIVAIAT